MGTMIAEKAEREIADYRRNCDPIDMPKKTTLRPDEVARILGCSEKHVRTLTEEGSLRAVDIRSAICKKPSRRITAQSVIVFWNKRLI